MKILVLDDEQYRHDVFNKRFKGHEITACYSADQAIKWLQKDVFDFATLDHDLGSSKTGLDVAKFICEMNTAKRPKSICVHSWNTLAAGRMLNLFRDYNIPCDFQLFHV